MIKVTFEFERVDEAIVALGKLVGTSMKVASASEAVTLTHAAAASRPSKRRGRSDKGQPRGSYKVDATTNASAPAATAPLPVEIPTTPVAAPVAPVAEAIQPAAPEKSGAAQSPAPDPGPTPAAAAITDKDAQAAVSKLFEAKGLQIALQVLSRFGARVVRELKPTQYAEFVQKVNDVLNGGEV